jgi:hypothetical protein
MLQGLFNNILDFISKIKKINCYLEFIQAVLLKFKNNGKYIDSEKCETE